MPADLRERLRNAPARQLPSARPYLESTCSDWISGRPAAETEARRRAETWQALEADVRAWRETALTSGQIVASGWPAGAAIGATRVTISADRWHGLRYDAAKNAAVDRATKAVVASGLDFEVTAPKRGPGRRRLRSRSRPMMRRCDFYCAKRRG